MGVFGRARRSDVALPGSISCHNWTVIRSESASITGMSKDWAHFGASLSFITAVVA